MSGDPRYQAGIIAGLKQYAHRVFRWPGAVEGLGRLQVGRFERCHGTQWGDGCKTWTFAYYGNTPLCLRCARGRAEWAEGE
jgi:hypothetical protein